MSRTLTLRLKNIDSNNLVTYSESEIDLTDIDFIVEQTGIDPIAMVLRQMNDALNAKAVSFSDIEQLPKFISGKLKNK